MGFGLKTDGAIHLHQLKSLDWAVRKAQFVEKVPDVLLQEVLERLLIVDVGLPLATQPTKLLQILTTRKQHLNKVIVQ